MKTTEELQQSVKNWKVACLAVSLMLLVAVGYYVHSITSKN